MHSCANCGKSVEGKPKACPRCGTPTGIDANGRFGLGHLAFLIFSLAVCGGMGIILLPIFASARSAARMSDLHSQAKLVAIAVIVYSSDYDDKFPPMESSAMIVKHIDKYLERPSEHRLGDFATSCTWNTAVACVPEEAIESVSNIWLFYSPRESRTKTCAMAFLDAHVKTANQYVFDKAMATKPTIVYPKDQKPTVIEPGK